MLFVFLCFFFYYPEVFPGPCDVGGAVKMAESEEEVDVLVQRVVKDITNALKRNPNMWVELTGRLAGEPKRRRATFIGLFARHPPGPGFRLCGLGLLPGIRALFGKFSCLTVLPGSLAVCSFSVLAGCAVSWGCRWHKTIAPQQGLFLVSCSFRAFDVVQTVLVRRGTVKPSHWRYF